MSFNHSPKIVTDGLVMYLDAGSPKSYGGSGTVWTDISRNSNNGTLVNGPTYSSANGGSIVFDGSNDYVNCGNNSSINIVDNISFGVWFNTSITSTGSNGLIAKRDSTTNYGINFTPSIFQVYYNTGSGFQVASVSTSNFPYGVWHSVVGVFRKNGSNTDILVYKNGSLLFSISKTGNVITSASNLHIGSTDAGSERFNGSIGSVQIYNRVLSQAEVLQNYNATKSRFGL
jgi:hypothetical protein